RRRARSSSSPGRRRLPVPADLPRDLAQVAPELLERRPAPEPVAVVGAVDAEVGKEREGSRDVRVVDAVGGLEELQLRLVAPVRIGEERPARAKPGPERRLDLGRVDADRDHPCVRDLDLVLKRDKPPEERLLLRAPPAAVEVEADWIAAGEVGQATLVARMVAQLDVRQASTGDEVAAHVSRSFPTAARRNGQPATSARAKSSGSNGRRSSSRSPTPISLTGKPSS